MVVRDACPTCGSSNYKKNGHIHNGKQNHQCKDCGRQFVQCLDHYLISEEKRDLIERLLLERISLRGICRAVGIGLKWLLSFIVNCFEALPDHLNVRPIASTLDVTIHRLEAEVDEMWSFVRKKANKQWIWIAMDAKTRQVIAFHVGDRSRDSAKELWANIPAGYQQRLLRVTIMKTVIGLFDRVSEAQSVVRDLIGAGFSRDEIGLIVSDATGEWSRCKASTLEGAAPTSEEIGTGVSTGTAVGGLGG